MRLSHENNAILLFTFILENEQPVKISVNTQNFLNTKCSALIWVTSHKLNNYETQTDGSVLIDETQHDIIKQECHYTGILI